MGVGERKRESEEREREGGCANRTALAQNIKTEEAPLALRNKRKAASESSVWHQPHHYPLLCEIVIQSGQVDSHPRASLFVCVSF